MARKLAELSVDIRLDSGKLKAGLRDSTAASKRAGRKISDNLRAAARRASDAFKGLTKGIGRALTSITGLLAGGALVAGFTRLSAAIDRTAKSARVLGLSVGAVQALGDAAEKSGVSTSTFISTLQAFQRRSAQAAEGTGELARILEQLNIDAEAFAALPLVPRLGAFADALGTLSTRAEQSAAAAAAFSRQGIQLLPLLDQGSEGIRQLGADFAATGAVISDRGAAGVETYNDTVQDLRTTLSALTNELVVELAPALTDIAKTITSLVRPVNDARKALVDGLGAAFLNVAFRIEAVWNDVIASILEGAAKVNASTAVLTGFLEDADAGAAQLNRATEFERAAAARRRAADQARANRRQLFQNSDPARRPAPAAPTNPLDAATAAQGGLPSPGPAMMPQENPSTGGFDLGAIRDAAASVIAGSSGIIAGLAGAVATRAERATAVTGTVQGVATAFGEFRTGEQIGLLRQIRDAVQETAQNASRGELL